MLYNMPSCVGNLRRIPEWRILSHHPNIAGIKDSGGEWGYFQKLCDKHRNREDFVIFMGPEELLAEAANGGVCGGGNLLPQVYSCLYLAAVRNDDEISHRKQTIGDIFDSVYYDDERRMKLIPGLKLAMEECGLCARTVAPPLMAVTESHAQRIRSSIPRSGLVSFRLPKGDCW